MNTTIHHLWFFLQGERAALADGFIAMLTGDITGSLFVLYTLKVVSALGRAVLRRRAA
ncbi:hypothetical protein [Achromobacter aegrifaciens]|uniref:hypothetical protein n=1 Tax=Achromobacter aegrifaciens TaxID=1287736 RepID=UPI0032080C9F